MPSRGQKIAGWVLSVLPSLLLAFSAVGKLSGSAAKQPMIAALGIPPEKLMTIGVLELGSVILFLVPKTSFLGAILITGYCGGGIFAHFRSDVPSPVGALLVSVVAWIGWSLRHPDVLEAAFGIRPS